MNNSSICNINKLLGRLQSYYEHLKNSKITNEYDHIFEQVRKNNYTKNNTLIIGKIQSGKTSFILYLMYKILLCNPNSKIIFFVGKTNDLLQQNVQLLNKFFIDVYSDIAQLDSDKKIHNSCIIPILKNTTNLDKLRNIINDNVNDFINNTYIIDDEADDYTSGDNYSSQIIWDIKNITKCSVVMVTATPFFLQGLPENHHNYPNFQILLNTSNEYCDLKKFFDHNKIEFISDNEININDDNNENIKWLWKCIYLFLFNSYIFSDQLPKDTKCIINIYSLKQGQQELYQYINLHIKNYFLENKKFIIEYILAKQKKYNYDYVMNSIIKILNKKWYGLVIANSNYDTEIKCNNQYQIFIGCNRINRGVVFKNLLSFFYMKKTVEKKKSADIMLQASRFLGYRNNYFDYMNIYINKEIYNQLQQIANKYDNIILDRKNKIDIKKTSKHIYDDIKIDINNNDIKTKITNKHFLELYDSCVDYCRLKYGDVKYSYKDKKSNRSIEGLIRHHIMEKQMIMLSSDQFYNSIYMRLRERKLIDRIGKIKELYKKYQYPQYLVYCNANEHLELHILLELAQIETNCYGVRMHMGGGGSSMIINSWFLCNYKPNANFDKRPWLEKTYKNFSYNKFISYIKSKYNDSDFNDIKNCCDGYFDRL